MAFSSRHRVIVMSSDYSLTNEQNMVRDTVRRMAQEKIAPLAAEVDDTGVFPTAITDQFKELGLFGLAFPESYGGSDMGILSSALVLEEIGRVCSSSAIVCAAPIITGRLILEYGGDDQKNSFLPRIVSGDLTATIALFETDAGSDPEKISAYAEKTGKQYIINGRKGLVDLADKAGLIIVFARAKNSGVNKGISAFLIEKDTASWAIERTVEKMGATAVHACDLAFEDCPVPEKGRLGEEGSGREIAVRASGLNCILTAARGLGIAQAALDYSLNYTQERVQFGRPISSFQGIQFMLADMATLVETGRCLVYKACAEVDRGQAEGYYLGAMAKCFVSDVAMKVSTDAIQLLGGYGYMKDHPVERMMRDAKLTQLAEGTNYTQHVLLAEGLFDL
ncbi:Butyryl-CoA dehydrogenase [uncultured Desulfobacterium sp.]|uniref:Butyryl-CoA dehydrogenase n=1 Tax=uncultured Desulfobacterium sp. TaxID=201089 RepID=A0A445N062_9BACT|nr:Butyryl-CoA dehydrogenase [uncultured Desulfobacterium sp.]